MLNNYFETQWYHTTYYIFYQNVSYLFLVVRKKAPIRLVGTIRARGTNWSVYLTTYRISRTSYPVPHDSCLQPHIPYCISERTVATAACWLKSPKVNRRDYSCRYPDNRLYSTRHNTDHRANGEATAHSNQAFGAFWSRVTPPELLYIRLLSFDELRLAMNAHLPVVRPLLCYARQGATPMHQKNRLYSTFRLHESMISDRFVVPEIATS